MYVMQRKSDKPQINYLMWEQRDRERGEAEDLARLRRRYLKTAGEKAPDTARENLAVFYEKVLLAFYMN